MTKRLYQWLTVIIMAGLVSCYPNEADYIEELDLVYTNFSEGFDFQGKSTYAMPDSVVKISDGSSTDPDGDGKPQFVGSTYSSTILNQIKQNMTANGWTQVSKNSNPDVFILPTTMTTTNIYYYYDWWYWDWWYGGYWGWYYPGWYYPAYVTGYRSGSVFLQMVDGSTLNPVNDNVAVVWSCIINGLAEGDTQSIVTRIQSTIDQAFSQSPYLKTN